MKQAALARHWHDGTTALGSFVFSRDPACTEIIGHAGFDFAVVDMEHAALDLRDVESHLRAAEAVGIAALVRIPGTPADPALASRVLDLGAHGLLLPHFGVDREACTRLLATLRYAPRGTRPSCSGVRAARHGLAPFGDYAREADDALLAFGLIEDMQVIDQLETLFEECRPDAVMPGPGDLATSLGVPGQPDHPEVRAAVTRVIEIARRAGLRVGIYLNAPEEAQAWAKFKLDFLVYLIDLKVLAQAYAAAARRMRDVASEAQ